MKKAKKTRVIPGYHLTFGIVITLLSLIVLIPLASVLVYALKLSPGEWFRLIMKENVRNAFLTSVGCSFLAAVINTVFGLILAWTLVKYEFPGKKLLDGFIELPFALPTAVAGITLSKLFTDSGFYGKIFAKLGIRIAYTKVGLVIALIFVGIPFVVRAVQPVLEKMDGQYEEAAFMLGAKGIQMGTVFAASKESVIHENYKNSIIKAKDIDSRVTGRSTGHPIRVLRNDMVRRYLELEKAGAPFEELEQLTLGSLRKAVQEGDAKNGSLMAGQIAGMIKEERSCEDIIKTTVVDAGKLMNGVNADE